MLSLSVRRMRVYRADILMLKRALSYWYSIDLRLLGLDVHRFVGHIPRVKVIGSVADAKQFIVEWLCRLI